LATPTTSGGPASSPRPSLLLSWKNSLKSTFTFGSTELEGLYQSYVRGTVGWYAWSFCIVNLSGWLSFLYKFSTCAPAARATLPPPFVPLISNLLPTVVLATGINLWPHVYAKHYSQINLVISVFQMGVNNYIREMLLWTQSDGFLGGPGPRGTTMLALENSFVVIMWFRVLTLPSQQFVDFAMVSAILLLNLAGNSHICGSAVFGPAPVTLSRPVMAVMESVSSRVLTSLLPGVGPHAGAWTGAAESLPCPAVLAFWEMVGWWISCMLVVVREVGTRRAFLNANKEWLRRNGVTQAAQGWPFGNARLLAHILFSALLLYCIAGFAWAVILTVYS
jgi:hypothetical protein